MAELKTKPTKASVASFLKNVDGEERKADCKVLVKMMKRITGEDPKMWGPTMVGFGKYHYKYASGHEGDMCITAFSPRKSTLTIYLLPELLASKEKMAPLGKFKNGKSCLHIKKLSDVDTGVLEKLIAESVRRGREMYPDGE